jgi:rare lipoprotein A (peptidoglycan hydrolase)
VGPSRFGLIVACAIGATSASCATRDAIGPDTPTSRRQSNEQTAVQGGGALDQDEGLATWYGPGFEGRKTANGERFDPSKMTAAHRTLKFGTWLEVTRLDNGQSVRVRVTDRGPFGDTNRIIDLSRGAADKLGIRKMGVASVKLRVVDGP